MLLLLAASQLFNDAMKMHHDRIVAHLATRSAFVAWLTGAFGRIPKLHPVVTFAVAAAALGLLADPNVSRNHAEIRPQGDRFAVVDLGSTNGTRVNGVRVDQRVLEDGDEIAFGNTRMRFEAS